MKTRSRSTKKSSSNGTPVAAARPEPEVRTAVGPAMQVDVGLTGITIDGRVAHLALSLDIPEPSMKENDRWPFTKWNVDYLRKQLEKDLRRVAQTTANFEYVFRLVEFRQAARAAAKPAPAAVATQPQPETVPA